MQNNLLTISWADFYDMFFVRWEELCKDCENRFDEKCDPSNCIEWKNLKKKELSMGQVGEVLEDAVNKALTDEAGEQGLVIETAPKTEDNAVEAPEAVTDPKVTEKEGE